MDDMGIIVLPQVARSYSSAACPLVMRLQISTVTYLTHDGSPTIVLDCAADAERQGSSQVQACSALRVVCLRPCSISRATDAQHRVSLGQRSVARLALPSHFDWLGFRGVTCCL